MPSMRTYIERFKKQQKQCWTASHWASVAAISTLHIFSLKEFTKWGSFDEASITITMYAAVISHTFYYFSGCVTIENLHIKDRIQNRLVWGLEVFIRISILIFINLQHFFYSGMKEHNPDITSCKFYGYMILLIPFFYASWHIVLRFKFKADQDCEYSRKLSLVFIKDDQCVAFASIVISAIFISELDTGAFSGIASLIGSALLTLKALNSMTADVEHIEKEIFPND